MTRPPDESAASPYVARVKQLGYTVTQRSSSYRRPDTGEQVPAVYLIESPGISFRLRDDELPEWQAFVDDTSHGVRLDPTGAGSLGGMSSTSNASLLGPIVPSTALGDPARGYPQFASQIELTKYGYVEEEFFFEGEATSWTVPELKDGLAMSAGHHYRSRMIVRRPADQRAFNGTAIVEWLNVTSFANVEQLWWEGSAPLRLMEQGFAYVGLSVQRHGVHAPGTGLKYWSPARYESLDVTDGGTVIDDSLAYDLFTQGGQLVSQGTDAVLGGMRPTKVLASGSSQSQRLLRRYFNSIHGTAQVYDGFLMAIGEGLIRRDVPGRVFRVNTETDVLRGGGFTRQPDSSSMRTWEVAGASHLSFQMSQARSILFERDGLPSLPVTIAEKPPLSRIPWGQPLSSAIRHLDLWVRDDIPPSCAPLIALETVEPDRSTATRDHLGNAVGGLRLSQHEVPIAVNQGLNSGPGLAPLWGIHIPFDGVTLRTMYPDRASYVEAVRQVSETNVRSGYLLPADAEANVEEATAIDLGVWS